MNKICEICSKKFSVPLHRQNTARVCSVRCAHKLKIGKAGWFKKGHKRSIYANQID